MVQSAASEGDPIVVTVMRVGPDCVLSPFFAKSDGILLVAPGGAEPTYLAAEMRNSASLCRLLTKTCAKRLVCGFITGQARNSLLFAGFDVRIGSCASPIQSLLADYDDLPEG